MRRLMLTTLSTIAVAILLTAGGLFGAELPESAKRLQAAMESALSDCRDQMLVDKMAAFVQYTNGLVSTSYKCRLAGNLEGVLAAEQELKRINKAVAIPQEDEPGTHLVICQARNAYRAAMAKAKESFKRKQKILIERHVVDLEAVKTRLTVDGKIEDAVAVKKVIELYKNVLNEINTPAVTVPDEETVTCPACSGTGKKLGPCPKCSGSGLCAMCSGEGVRKAMMMGVADRMPCITCKRSGKCAQCGGAGKVSTLPCDACQGAGKVTSGKAGDRTSTLVP
jgi:hypothetical protein